MASVAVSTSTNSTGQGYVLSFLLHVGVIALAWVGIPFFHRDVHFETPPLIVDLVPISDITSAAPQPTPEPAPAAPVAPPPEPPKPVQAEAPASDAMPVPQEKLPDKPAEKPQPQVKPVPKPTPPPKSKKDDIAMLQDLLKDMQKKAPKEQPQTQSSSNTPSNNIAPSIADRASMTELDAIRRHIEGCWRIDPGNEGAENMSADIKVFINPDGTARAQIVDTARYFADPAFRAFATTARNAVLGCGNIPISPERYNVFKEMTMTFSPQGRIN